jgi:hypothetical protein
MPRALSTSSASGVVGPLAASQSTLTPVAIFSTVSPLIWFSSAAGIRTSTSCSSQAMPGSTS